MRVLLVTGSGRRGGAEGQLTRLATELVGRGVDCRVAFTGATGVRGAELDRSGVRWRAYGASRPSRSDGDSHGLPPLRAAIRIGAMRRDMATWRPDVVHAWLPQAVVAALTGNRRSVRIAAFRGQVLPRDLGALASVHLRAVRRAHAITVNSRTLIDDHVVPWGGDPARVHLIPNGVDIAGPTADPDAQIPTAAVVANFLPYKGHDVLIEALTQVTAPVRVTCYGASGGPALDDLRKLAADRGVWDRISFVEDCSDLPAALAAAQFAIHPSLTEGLSNAILEELAAGLPVVATDVGGNPTLIESGTNGEVVPAADAQQLARAIDRVAADADHRRRLARQARSSVARFSWSRCTDAHVELYERLLREQR